MAELGACAWLASDLDRGFLTCRTFYDIKGQPISVRALGQSPRIVRLDLQFVRLVRSSLKCDDIIGNNDLGIDRIRIWNVGISDLDVVKMPTLLVRSYGCILGRTDDKACRVIDSLGGHSSVLPLKMSLLLRGHERITDLRAVVEESLAGEFDHNLNLVNVAGAGHMSRPVKIKIDIDQLVSLEVLLWEDHTVVIVNSSGACLAELPVIFLSIDDLAIRIQILVALIGQGFKKSRQSVVAPQVRSLSTGIVVTN